MRTKQIWLLTLQRLFAKSEIREFVLVFQVDHKEGDPLIGLLKLIGFLKDDSEDLFFYWYI